MRFKYILITLISMVLLGSLISCNDNDSTASYQYYRVVTAPIVESMTLKQKLGQMTLPKYSFLISEDETYLDYSLIEEYALGAMLVAAGEVPDGDIVDAAMNDADAYLTATSENWAPLITGTNDNAPVITLEDGQRLTIPLLTGIDAVHGFHEVLGNVIFPHNIGLSMTNDTDLLTNVGQIVANDLLQLGFNWAYAPTVAIKHNPNWGRTYETQGSVPEKVRINTEAMVKGLQQFNQGVIPETGVLATVKHFIGDGATQFGIDEGNTLVLDEDRFIDVNAQGYAGAIDANVGSLMVSYSAINSIPMSIEDDLKTRLLNGDLLGDAFTGFIVSDYGAATNIADRGLPTSSIILPYQDALAASINTGIDMIMISSASNEYKTLPKFLTILEQTVTDGLISESRIDEAVNSILAVKYAMGLISVDSDGNWSHQFKMLDTDNYTQDEKIAVALTAAEKSLVLLKNDDSLLPIDTSSIEYVVFTGDATIDQLYDTGDRETNIYQNYDNIGAQTGGWTISWQGIQGNLFWEEGSSYKATSGAASILDSIEVAFPNATLLYPNYGDSSATTEDDITTAQTLFKDTTLLAHSTSMTAENTLIIGVLAENPTAEFMGDSSVFYCEDGTPDDDGYIEGCLYSFLFNPYVLEEQAITLAIDYQSFDTDVITQVQGYDTSDTIPLISILISGRDRIIDGDGSSALSDSDAFIAAWLPGPTGGTAIVNAITGAYLFCGGASDDGTYCNEDSANTLSIDWVATDGSLDNYPIYTEGSGFVAFDDPLYEIGYGLPTFALSE